MATKPAFRGSFRQRRCLIPADGYYEWQAQPGTKTKQPWFITLTPPEPFAFAGLWDRWGSPEDEVRDSCSIIVTAANSFMQPIHDRMPVILDLSSWDIWLDPANRDVAGLQAWLQPYPADVMNAWPVSTRVNSPRAMTRRSAASRYQPEAWWLKTKIMSSSQSEASEDRTREVTCRCSGTTADQIQRLVAKGIRDLEGISRASGACSGCGGCEYDVSTLSASCATSEP